MGRACASTISLTLVLSPYVRAFQRKIGPLRVGFGHKICGTKVSRWCYFSGHMTRHFRLFSLVLVGFFLLTWPLAAQWVDANPVKNVAMQPDGMQLELRTGFLRFRVCTNSIVH